jgi:hypothetical protein
VFSQLAPDIPLFRAILLGLPPGPIVLDVIEPQSTYFPWPTGRQKEGSDHDLTTVGTQPLPIPLRARVV